MSQVPAFSAETAMSLAVSNTLSLTSVLRALRVSSYIVCERTLCKPGPAGKEVNLFQKSVACLGNGSISGISDRWKSAPSISIDKLLDKALSSANEVVY